jgi:outer membrane protease
VNTAFWLAAAGALALIISPITVRAADLSEVRPGPFFATSGISAELFAGRLSGQSRELVYNVPGDRSKLSQLNWQIDSAAVIGGSIDYQVLHGFELKARGWVHASSDNRLDDFDWLSGYQGFESWTDLSHYNDTRIAKAFQLDLAGAARVFAAGPVAVTASLGYRFETVKWNAYGGSYLYSTNGFRDDVGSFPADEISIAYQQWWHTPYLGLGASYRAGPLVLAAEVIGSPLVVVHDRDNHVESLFKEDFRPTKMVGASISAELKVGPNTSLLARAEAEQYFEAKGGIEEYDLDPPDVSRFPKPAAGVDHQQLLLSLGVKAQFL